MEENYENEQTCESYEDYGPQGYHPVVLGQKFNGVYTVVQKLGWGHFSTVWLVRNQVTEQFSALKIQRSKPSHYESALDEIRVLEQIRKHQNDPLWSQFIDQSEKQYPQRVQAKLCRPLLLLDSFVYFGIHGKHLCLVFELMGPNLLDVIQHYEDRDKRMPLWLVKKITRDVLLGLIYLHDHCGIIHTDLKPENIMIKLEPDEENQLIEQIRAYQVKPISMKFLRNSQLSKNSKNKRKNEKKKLKKKLLKEAGSQQDIEKLPEEDEESQSRAEEIINKVEEISAEINEQSGSEISHIENANTNQQQQIVESIQESKAITAQQTGKPNEDVQVDMGVLSWKNVKIALNDKLFFKIVDMGNACFTKEHFTDSIQTRQYRSPEVLLGIKYEANTDIWSLACTVYEMMTNSFLFKPDKVEGIRKDQNHLYKMIEVLGDMDRQFLSLSHEATGFFNKKGKLLHGHPPNTVPICKLLIDQGYDVEEAMKAQNFLLPMLIYDPKKRISARECYANQWLWS